MNEEALPKVRGETRPPRNRADFAARTLALWFGCGRFRPAPGTAGTIGAIPLYFVLSSHGPMAFVGASILIALVGVWSGGRVARALGTKDPQCVCIDEVAGVLLTWAACPTRSLAIVGFVLFRIFDTTKPPPARAAERLPGGWGIVIDDMVAGAWAALVILVLDRCGAFDRLPPSWR